MFVYIIVNRVNGKYYVGKTTTANLQSYFRVTIKGALRGVKGRTLLNRAIRKHGAENFCIEPLISTLTTDAELCHWERELIARMQSQNPKYGYNLAGGGGGTLGFRHSSDSKRRISENNANRLRGLSTDHKARIGNATRKTWTPERRKLQGELMKQRTFGIVPWNKGRTDLPSWNRGRKSTNLRDPSTGRFKSLPVPY